MNNGCMIYLASPYSHPDPKVRQRRFEEVCVKAAELMKEGFVVFCPIAHTHPLTEYTDILAQKDHGFWLAQDFMFLKNCRLLFVYMIPGWKESYGVNAEIEFAIKHNIPVAYVNYDHQAAA